MRHLMNPLDFTVEELDTLFDLAVDIETYPAKYAHACEGRKLANELGVDLCGLLLGDNVEGLAKELGGYGADKVYVCEDPLLAVYNTDAYAKVICDVIEELKPEAFLIGATNIGRDLAPRCAARLHTGLCADCTHLDIDVANYIQFLRESSTLDVDGQKWDMEDRNLKMTRPAFGGHLMATIICPRFRPCMATVRPGVMKKNAFDQAKADACVIEKPAFPSLELGTWLREKGYDRVELVGLVSYICVLSNAVIAKAALPEAEIVVDAACTAGPDLTLHEKALDLMETLQIAVTNR